jgi:hypothetical protein
MGHAEPLFAAWSDFYVIIGSSAAALTGLQFVVIALAADRRLGSEGTTTAFSTPTVIHFTTVLAISSLLSAPWHTAHWPAVLLATLAVAGLGYVCLVIRAARAQRAYQVVAEDIIWHWVLPAIAHVAVVLAAVWRLNEDALFAVAGAALLLLLVGIHNAWDSATFITTIRQEDPPRS